jgi:tetratricopeptide (TPR) repeat protein
MKKSPEFNPDMHSYEVLGPGALGAFSEIEALVQQGLLAEAKSGLEEIFREATVSTFSSSFIPDADVNLRKRRFGELRYLAMALGKAASLLEYHDDRQAISYFSESLKVWSCAWGELGVIISEWGLSFQELVDEDFDSDYSYSYAFRIAECYERLEEWREVISAVARYSWLSGPIGIIEHALLADAYDNLGDYDKCIESNEFIRRHWYDEDNADEELRVLCNMALVAKAHGRFKDAIHFYDRFSEYYWRFESVAGRIEFNKACLWLASNDLGEAYVVFHSARRYMLGRYAPDLVRCENAISSLQSAISDGDGAPPVIELFDLNDICQGTC